MKRIKFLILLAGVIILTSCGKKKDELVISVAASLTEAIKEIEVLYEEKFDIELTVNIASSGTLQKQIEEGAPVDVFLSASEAKMDNLQEKMLLLSGSRKNLLRNNLVLIKSKGSKYEINKIDDLDKEGIKIALGEPGSVPVGRYSKEALQNYMIWEDLNDKFVFAKNVKQTLAYVESGEADAGIVYFSDTGVLKESEIVTEIPNFLHEEIVYPIAVIKGSKNQENTREFIEFLETNQCKDIFIKNKFTLY